MIDNLSKYISLFIDTKELLRPRNYIFIVSHMRARTTLLSHILASNTEICGHEEQHISYVRNIDLFKLKAQLRKEENYLEAKYLCDKLLHNRLSINERLFSKSDKFVVVVREPIGTFNSMAKMHIELWGNKNYMHLQDYYFKRLEYLKTFINKNRGVTFCIDSDKLEKDAANTLKELSGFLHLNSPLSSEYRTFDTTGEPGKGDPGVNIKSGKIVKVNREIGEVFDFDYNRAREVFEEFVESCKFSFLSDI